MVTAPESLRVRKQEFVRDALWTAAIDLFSSKGFDETTVDDIVAAAGTSRRTFFRYFESKRDLMAQPVASYAASLAQAIESCPKGAKGAQLLRHVVRTVAAKTVMEPRLRQVMDVAARYPSAREAQLSRVAELQDRVAEAFTQRGEDEVRAHLLAGMTLNALSVAYRIWFGDGKQDIHAATEHVLREMARLAQGS
jgi:TetR/AcrR family transcriptional regulator, regulator of mycofactocin system